MRNWKFILFDLTLSSTKWRTLAIGIITGSVCLLQSLHQTPELIWWKREAWCIVGQGAVWFKCLGGLSEAETWMACSTVFCYSGLFLLNYYYIIIIVIVIIIFYLIIIIISSWKTWKNILKIEIELYGNFQTTLIWIKKTQLINLK